MKLFGDFREGPESLCHGGQGPFTPKREGKRILDRWGSARENEVTKVSDENPGFEFFKGGDLKISWKPESSGELSVQPDRKRDLEKIHVTWGTKRLGTPGNESWSDGRANAGILQQGRGL